MSVALTLAIDDYDRVRGLVDGTAPVAGVDLTVLRMPVEETFFRMLRYREFDAAEMSLSAYVLSLAEPEPPFVALPVFPSRLFRHSAVYLGSDRGIREPSDLAGRRIGLPTYEMTAAVWIRGILEERHDLPADSPEYVIGGLHDAGRVQLAELDLPERYRVSSLDPGTTLVEELLAGRLDAVYSARAPRPFVAGDPRVRRLFEDAQLVSRQYFAATRIFPIMHVVVLRRDVYERRRWLARALTEAFVVARDQAYTALEQTGSLRVTLPWLGDHLAETVELMGHDFWPYGTEPNRHVLETYLRYATAQGLNPAAAGVDELFAPELATSFGI